MKKIFVMATVLLCMFTVTTAFAAKVSPEEQRKQVDELSVKTLNKLYSKRPDARRIIEEECYAWATLSSTSIKGLILGSSHGRGIAYNNQTGERFYMRMKEISAGIGLGAKEYNLVFIIKNRDAWDNFISGKIRFASSAEATANDGVSGGSFEDASYVAPGVWVYQMTTKGLTLEATLKGMKVYKDRKLN